MWQPVLMICGYFISVLGIAMLIPAAVDIYYSHLHWSNFINAAIVSMFVGLSLFLSNRGKIKDISIQQAYLLTVLSWTSVAFLSALPFMFFGASWVDALFEGASGVSTTGATIYTDIEALPKALLLWRALLNGLGGVGIVIFATALLPFLGVGGMQIFQRENSDVNEKFTPKMSYMAKKIIFIYLLLMSACLVSYHFAGMGWFDAVCHALATISTGGASTKNTSLAWFQSEAIDWLAILFMFAGALPLAFYSSLWSNRGGHSLRSIQVKAFIKVLLVYIAVLSVWLWYKGVYAPFEALRHAMFSVVSLVTSTGYNSADFLQWGAFMATAVLIFSLTGGCSGSTSGSIKIFRWQVLWALLKRSFVTTTEPNRLVPLKIGGVGIASGIAASVSVFFIAYSLTVAVMTVAIALQGVDFMTAFGAVIACITNVGVGMTSAIGPYGSYAEFGGAVKLLLAATMIIGRLEVMTVLVLLNKNFWR
jgi:trk system potassium uptake protein TrkH